MKIALVMAFVACSAGASFAQGIPTATQNPPPSQQAAPASTGAGGTAIDPAKEAAIRKLFKVPGTEKTMEQVMVSMTNNMKPLLVSSLPPGDYRDKLIDLFFQKFQSKMHLDELLNRLVPVYDQHLTKDDIDQLILFYQTPLGQKFISFLPQMVTESQKIGMQWGEKLGRDSMQEVLDEHPEMKKALEDAAGAPRK